MKKSILFGIILLFFVFQNCSSPVANEQDLASSVPVTEDTSSTLDPTAFRYDNNPVIWQGETIDGFSSVTAAGKMVSKNDNTDQFIRTFYGSASMYGTWYFEVIVWQNNEETPGQPSDFRIGIASEQGRNYTGNSTVDAAFYGIQTADGSAVAFDGTQMPQFRSTGSTSPVNTGDVIGVLVSNDNGTVTFYNNGIFMHELAIVNNQRYSPYVKFDENQNGAVLANFGANDFRYSLLPNLPLVEENTNMAWANLGWKLPSAPAVPLISVSQDRLTVTKDDSNYGSFNTAGAYADFDMNSGLWYFEVTLDAHLSSGTGVGIGIASVDGRDEIGTTGTFSIRYGMNGSYSIHDGVFYNSFTTDGIATQQPLQVGDIVGVLVNHNTNTVSFYVNGVVQYSDLSINGMYSYSPMFMGSNNSNGTATINYGNQPFAFPVPAGATPAPYYQ